LAQATHIRHIPVMAPLFQFLSFPSPFPRFPITTSPIHSSLITWPQFQSQSGSPLLVSSEEISKVLANDAELAPGIRKIRMRMGHFADGPSIGIRCGCKSWMPPHSWPVAQYPVHSTQYPISNTLQYPASSNQCQKQRAVRNWCHSCCFCRSQIADHRSRWAVRSR